jgi:rubrerythrin
MELDDYLRDLARFYRQLAATAQGPDVRDEYLDLASVCEEVANDVEEHMTPG